MADTDQTTAETPKFDFDAFPPDTLFYDRRSGLERREQEERARLAEEAIAAVAAEEAAPTPPPVARERRARKERRRRIDPTTFEKQYTDDEMEFMTAMQRFKVQSGKPFPNHAEVLTVARSLGYRRAERPALVPGLAGRDSDN